MPNTTPATTPAARAGIHLVKGGLFKNHRDLEEMRQTLLEVIKIYEGSRSKIGLPWTPQLHPFIQALENERITI